MNAANDAEPRVSLLQLSNLLNTAASSMYQVPIYQRDYAWSHEEIDALMGDLIDFTQSESSYYLLGQIIVAPGEDPYKWELVDGQQRLTSLFLVFLAAYKLLQSRGAQGSDDQDIVNSFANLNRTLVQKVSGKSYLRVLPAKGGEEMFNKILNGEALPVVSKNNTAQNIKANYEEIFENLNAEFQTIESLIGFAERVLEGVWIMRLEMASNQLALDVFEKINNRGKALNSADLLKNLLFSQSNSDEFDDLSKIWETAVEKIFAIKTRRAASMEFLMQAWIFAELGQSISTRKVFEAWRGLLYEKPEALARFASLLPHKSEALNWLGNGKTNTGDIAFNLSGTRFFGAIQHFIVLLAGSHLSATSFKNLSEIVEDRTVLSLLARERSQDFQRILPKWAFNIQQLDENASREDILKASETALEAVPNLLDDLELKLPRLTYAQESQKKRIRYVLARVSSAIEIAVGHAHSENTLTNCLKTTTKTIKGYDLDHILPQSIPTTSFWDPNEDPAWVDEIGNIVLLHPTDNRSAGDVWPEEKVADYNSSHLTLTRSLCDLDALGQVNNRVQAVINKLHGLAAPNLSSWTSEMAAARANLYYELLREDLSKTLLK